MNPQDPMAMEEYLKMLQMGGQNAQLDDEIKMQMAQAEAMRGAAPQMGGNSRVQVAPNVLELMGGLAKEGVSQHMMGGVRDKQAQRNTNATAQNEALMRAILGAGKPHTPPVPNGAPGMLNPNLPPQGAGIPLPFGFKG